MLEFILGKAASGKTFEIHNRVLNEAKQGNNNVILLVPEQYSFETERQMLRLLGSGFMNMVQVLSFTRMCEVAGQLYGGISGMRIDDAQRRILVGRAVKKSAPHLKVFKKYANTPDFIRQSAEIIEELKQAGISPYEISAVEERITNSSLKSKLDDIALIYASYDELINGIYTDPLDDMEILYKRAEENGFFDEKTVYLDAFKGFTGAQVKLLRLMLLRCKKVVISFCTDSLEDKTEGAGAFSNIISVANRILKYANENGIPVSKPVILDKSHYSSSDLENLEKLLSGASGGVFEGGENITVGKFNNPFEEIECVFKNIHRLVRTEGYLFGDFVVIARNIGCYERIIESASKKFEVPCYMDKRKALSYSPLATFIIAALTAARKINTESILAFVKSGLLGFSDEEISVLEEYVYVWEIDSDVWCKDWDMNPDGFAPKDNKVNYDEIKLRRKEINDIRKRIIIPILKLKGTFSGGSTEISKGIYDLLMFFGVDASVKKYCDNLLSLGDSDSAYFVMDSWDAVMNILDNMVRCYGDDRITAEEYISMLELSFGETTIGSIPRTLDEVSCGSADRIRPARPKIVFVVGLNSGEFPSIVSDGGLLLRSDRFLLEKAGFEISDRFRSFAVDESFLVYSSLCCANEKVFAFCHKHTSNGIPCEESTVISKILRSFDRIKTAEIYSADLPETKAEGFSRLAAYVNKPDTISKSLEEIFMADAEYSKRINLVKKMAAGNEHRLSAELCNMLFKNDIFLTASRIEQYNSCAFSYFCRYVLGINRLQKANLDTLQRGTLVHFVLECVLKEFGKNIADISEDSLVKSIDFYMQEYLKSIEGYEYLKQPRFEFLYNSIGKMLKYILLHISNEFTNSDFEPVSFELKISDDGDIPALCLEFSNNRRVNIVGSIDRVDLLKGFEGDNYIRVVDYKTGKKVFYLPDVLYGLNMQMLIYLYAVKKSGGETFGKIEPAGILYMPSKRGLVKEGEKKGTELSMNGMLIDNDGVLRAMDKENSGKFVPKKTSREREGDPIISKENFDTVFEFVDLMIRKTAKNITDGIFDVNPTDGRQHNACDYCDFSSVCKIEESFEHKCPEKMASAQIFEKMKEAKVNDR